MEARAHLSRVQILSHQSKIASKIELYIGDGPSYEQVGRAGPDLILYYNSKPMPPTPPHCPLTYQLTHTRPPPPQKQRLTSSGWGT